MGIYLPNMDMPKNCGRCRFAGVCGVHTAEEWPDLESILFNDVIGIDGVRDPECPLVSVPPHGNLIEKNDIFRLISASPEIDKLLTVQFMKALYELPTVIPASEVGE